MTEDSMITSSLKTKTNRFSNNPKQNMKSTSKLINNQPFEYFQGLLQTEGSQDQENTGKFNTGQQSDGMKEFVNNQGNIVSKQVKLNRNDYSQRPFTQLQDRASAMSGFLNTSTNFPIKNRENSFIPPNSHFR